MDNTKHLDKVKPRQSRQATVYVVDLLTFVTCPRKARLSRGVLVKKKKKNIMALFVFFGVVVMSNIYLWLEATKTREDKGVRALFISIVLKSSPKG